jgi:hypothetical protein
MDDWIGRGRADITRCSNRTAPHPRLSRLCFPNFPPTLRLMGRHTHNMALLSLLVLNAARAHEHDEDLTEEAAHAAVDSILWIHIFLQAAVWGILFPIGMVLGLSRSRWHAPLQVCPRPRLPPSFTLSHLFIYRPAPYHDFTSANPLRTLFVDCRDRAHARRLHTRARARWPTISFDRPWQVCQYPPHTDCGAACAGSVPQAAHSRADTAPLGRAHTRCHRKVISSAGMGPDALWSNRVSRVLS